MTDTETRVMIASESDTILAVIAVREMAGKLKMGRGATSSLATAVSELATNIIKYAKRGKVTLRAVRRRHQPGIEAIVEDRGPGIDDIETAMKEHTSTSGTLGLGLPGTKRLVDEFEITSEPGQGTRVRVVKWG